jgi:radical SAM-linked protein
MDPQRVLFRFRKEGNARFLSHHDLMRLFERALRRAGLPLRMSEGFNPHPRFSIVLALPLGVEATDEALEVQFQPPLEPADALARLQAQMPAGLSLTGAQALPAGADVRVESVVYEADLPADAELEPDAVERLLACDALVVERTTPKGTRTIDLRPALAWMRLDSRRLAFQLAIDPGGTPRPTEVLNALLRRDQPASPAAPAGRLRRTKVNLAIASRAPSGPSGRTPQPAKGAPHAT